MMVSEMKSVSDLRQSLPDLKILGT